MSRIGRDPITVPNGVDVSIDGQHVVVKGPKGELDLTLHDVISMEKAEDGRFQVLRADEDRETRALHGLSRTLVQNMVTGVTEGYTIKMEIHGVGYRVALKGTTLEFSLGYSHPVSVEAPAGVTFQVENPTRFSISGIHKQQVGQAASEIKRLRRHDPYKGKGIRYEGEQVRRKVGKTGK